MTKNVVIVSAARTAIGAFGGSLKRVDAPNLAATVMKEVINRAGLEDSSMIGDVRFGCCLEPADALNIGRVASLMAGIPDTVPGMTVNRVCISGMEATLSGVSLIQSGFHDIILAGGVESMSNVPYVLDGARWGTKLGPGKEHKMIKDALTHGLHAGSHYVPYPKDGPLEYFRGKPYIMGLTAEFLAQKHGFTRVEQDEVAVRSHNLAEEATTSGHFADEIVDVKIKTRKGEVIFNKDEHFRPGQTMEALAKLRPAFIPKTGTVTAGNASGINDGAAALLIMSEEKANELGLKPLAKIAHMGIGATAPEYMGESPIPAVNDLLRRSGMKLDEFERIEVNEAFASQYLATEKGLSLNRDVTNVHGSGIGLGHPVGATGARIMVTLLYEMMKNKKDKGLATLCGGGGVSMAAALELM